MILLLEAETLQACESESSVYSIQSCKGDKTVTQTCWDAVKNDGTRLCTFLLQR